MKNKKRWIVLGACLMISLTACGEEEEKQPAPEQKVEESVSVNNKTLKADSIVISVGKTTVTYEEYKAYHYFMKHQYENIVSEDLWNSKVSDKTLKQEALEEVIRFIIQMKVIGRAAGDQGVELDANAKVVAETKAKEYCALLDEKTRKENGITEAILTKILQENLLATQMYNVVTGKVDVNFPADQIQATKVQMLYLSTEGKNKEEVRAIAQNLVKKLGTTKGNFYRFANANSDLKDVEQVIGAGDSRTTLAKTALGLKKGETSGLIEESDGFYIVYCVQPSNRTLEEEYRNQRVEEKQVLAFQSAYENWAQKYEVEVSKSLLME